MLGAISFVPKARGAMSTPWSLVAFALSFLLISTAPATAQLRGFAAGAIILDDGNGHTVTLVAPSGMTSNYTYAVPASDTVMPGSVPAGTAPGQLLAWSGSQWMPIDILRAKDTSFAPANDSATDLGDATHRFRRLYVTEIVGPTGSADLWQRSGNTLEPMNAGDNITTTGNITTVGGGMLASQTGVHLLGASSELLMDTSAGSAGQLLVSNGPGATPSWKNVSASVISFGGITSDTNTSATMSVGSGGSIVTTGGKIEATAFKAAASSSDAVDLNTSEVAGTLPISNGGTGASSAQAAIDSLLPAQAGHGGHVLTTDGSNVNWAAASGTGTVTHVGLSAPSEFTVSGSPITDSGTISIAKADQSSNYVYAGPATGLAGPPGFRALVAADIPDNGANTTGTSANVTGVVAVANGGTGATNATNARSNIGAAASGANSDITSLTGLTTALPIAEGGTGATNATTARSNIGAASSGANGDITSITGLTTALPIAEGGTGATNATNARSNIGAAASGANGDITSLTGLTTALPIAEGGTGATNATTARSNIGAASSGANGDITSLTGLTTALPIAEGGTGATNGTTARSNMGAAASGANGDITSLTGLTTALPISEGGTGATNGTNARANIGAASSGANGDITSLTGLTTALPISEGGTGATDGTNARANIGAAASGANSDITSLTSLTTPLPVSEGGTGLSNLVGANRLIYSGSDSTLVLLTPGNPNDVLTLNGSGVPSWSAPTSTSSISFNNVTSGINTDTLSIGVGGSILLGGGIIEASKVKGGGSTSDAVDLATAEVNGMLPIANGGTGANTGADAINNLLPSQTGNDTKVLQTDGTNVSWARVATGTVTSLALDVPPEFAVSGSPITTNGTITIAKANQAANTVYAGPSSGSDTTPAFRQLASSDIPDNAANTTGTAANVTGIVGIAHGGTGAATASAAFDSLSPMTATGDMIYRSAGGSAARLPGNVATTRKFLTQVGDGVGSGAPQWSAISSADLVDSTITISTGTGLSGGGAVALGNTLTLTNTGVTSLAGTTNQINVSSSNGAVTLSTPQSIGTNSTPTFAGLTLSEPLGVSNGGTGVATASANTFFAGPDATSGAPSFRALLASDIPSLANSYIANNTSQQSGASFNITGTGAIGTSLTIGASALDANDQFGISKQDYTSTAGLGVLSGDSGVSFGSRTSGKELRLFTTGAAAITSYTNGVERLRIDSSGNVGIGTPTPGSLLTVNGDLLLSNSGTASQLALQGTSSGISTFAAGAQGATTIHYTLPASQPSTNDVLQATSVSGTGPYNVTLGWTAMSGGGSGSGWGLTGTAIASGDVLGTTNAQDLVIETNGSERLRVLSTGSVGIGTASPNARLDVKDGNLRLSNSGTATTLQLQGTGSGVTSFQAGAQDTNNITYTLPTSQGTSGAVLRNNGSGTLSWSQLGRVQIGRRTENFNVTSTALQSDTSLVVALDANAVYTFQTFLSLNDPNGAGVSYAYTYVVPSGSTIKWGFSDPGAGLGTTQTIVTASATQSPIWSLNGTKEMYYPSTGVVVTGSTSGTLQFRLRKVTGGTSTDPVRLNVNSYMLVTRVG